MSKRPDRRIKLVKITKEDRIEIHYELKSEYGGWDYCTVNSGETGRAEFYTAIEQIGSHATGICELPGSYLPVEVRAIRFTHSGMYGTLGAVITFRKKLRGGTYLYLATPHRYSEPHQERGDLSVCLTPACVNDLTRVMREATKYLNGDRRQLGLFGTEHLGTSPQPKLVGSSPIHLHPQQSLIG